MYGIFNTIHCCAFFPQQLVFNSVTNCLGPRKFMHSGKLYKAKSNKELYGFLFNDFLLLTQIIKPLGSSGTDKVFSPKSNLQYKMYKTVSVTLQEHTGTLIQSKDDLHIQVKTVVQFFSSPLVINVNICFYLNKFTRM